MKIRYFFFVFLATCQLIFTSHILAQEQGNVRFSLMTERLIYDNRTIQNYGLAVDWFVADWCSLQYSFAIGNTSKRKFYANVPLGAWISGVPLRGFVSTWDDSYLFLLFLTMLLPEGANFHIPVNEQFKISPFVYPLGMYYEESAENNNGRFIGGLSTGLRFNVFKDNFSFSPYAGVRTLYQRDSGWGLLVGLSVGISF
jgi:hypothetical protein